MRTGVLNPCWRMVARISNPFLPGSITSRTTRSKDFRLNQVKSLFAGVCQSHGVLFGLQAFLQRLAQLLFVLDHQNPHSFFPLHLYIRGRNACLLKTS